MSSTNGNTSLRDKIATASKSTFTFLGFLKNNLENQTEMVLICILLFAWKKGEQYRNYVGLIVISSEVRMNCVDLPELLAAAVKRPVQEEVVQDLEE